MTITVDIPKEIEAGLAAEAQARGVTVSDCLRDIVLEYYEDRDDELLARSRLEDRQPSLSSAQMRKNLGLDG